MSYIIKRSSKTYATRYPGSNRIERVGATGSVSRQVCNAVFHQGRIRSTRNTSIDRPFKEEVQHVLAFKYFVDVVIFDKAPWTEELLKNTHTIFFEGLDHPVSGSPWTVYGGKYRDAMAEPYDQEMNVKVNAGVLEYTPALMVPIAMRQTLTELNEEISEIKNGKDVDPFWLAAIYYVKFMRIHPFLDGNGRICRIILNTILLKYALVVVPLGATEEDQKRIPRNQRKGLDRSYRSWRTGRNSG